MRAQSLLLAVALLAVTAASSRAQVVAVSGGPSNDPGTYVLLANGDFYRGFNGAWGFGGNVISKAGGGCSGSTRAVGLAIASNGGNGWMFALTAEGDVLVVASQGLVVSCHVNVFAATGRPPGVMGALGSNASGGIFATTTTGETYRFYETNVPGVEYIGGFGVPTPALRESAGQLKVRYR